ncbi:hypothetical protein HG537_0D02310 [Torulaspora globosa]|uniref:U3 small nucleolar RNA-associated protein 22 n=1 Tax=Torulaspora globosa TaxID=48254 RepID=A0A7H9HS84_9SACH|nr:hypothetical protein HG537_0D02310 [Torulaspora sp. CBS 2947]
MSSVKRRASQIEDIAQDTLSRKKLIEIKEDKFRVNDETVEHDEAEHSGEDSDEESKNVVRPSNTAAQDIHIAKETAELFQSNIFKLQIDELMQQVKLKDSHILKMEKVLHMLHDMINEVPDWEEKTMAEADAYFKGKITKIPFVDPKPDFEHTNYKVNYKRPEILLIGSFALKAGISQPSGSTVDVLLTMPAELFEKKDFLNFRCLHKRSVYLAYLTHHLMILIKRKKLDDLLHLEYSYFNGDSLLPVLKISCKGSDNPAKAEYNFHKTKFSINLIIGFPYKIFDAKKLLPNRNCIRVAHEETDVSLPATPLYNFSVLSSTTYEAYLKFLYKTKKQTESFKEAAKLGRLWLQQRGFSSKMAHSGGLGGFGTFEFMVLMSALLNGGGLNGNKILLHGFSSYQLFKGTIKMLATTDLCQDNHLEFHSDASAPSKVVEEGFQIPTLYDKTTKVNILSKMSISSYEILRMYAKETMSMLNNVVQDQFANIFLTNINKIENVKYDFCYDLQLPVNGKSDPEFLLNSKFGPMEKITFITLENFLVNKIANVIKLALGDRIKFVEIELDGRKDTFPITKRKVYHGSGNYLNFESVKINIINNPAESEKLVTKGPVHLEEPTPEAIAFKNFWGPKASLRRFKDGSITHCCIWSTSSSMPIISSILDYVMKKHISEHASIKSETTEYFQNLLPLPNLPASSKTSVLNLASFYNIKKSFDDLYRLIFEIELPLSLKSILPVGTAFRYTSLCQPVPFAYSDPDFFQEVILEFETSPKWPDEIISLEKSKAALLLKIQSELESKHNDKYRCFFTRDESIPNNLDITLLNILTPEGFGFKIRVLTERDEVLYLRAISNARQELKPELEKTFLKFTARYLASIRHTRTIESISHSYQFYSPVVRLFKKWLDSHLLLGHLNDELVELLAIKPFVNHAPYSIPGSVENGFLKVLKFISEWNWKEEPLVLDLTRPDDEFESIETRDDNGLDAATLNKLSEKLSLAQYKGIQSNFTNLRNGDPNGLHLQFFVASKNDPSGLLYSTGILLPIATRLTALAKVAINLIKTHGVNKQTIDLLFTPALKDYDFVLTLKTPVPLKSSSGIATASEFKNITNDQSSHNFPSDLSQLSDKMDPTFHLVKYLNMKYKNSIIFSSHRYISVHGTGKGDKNVVTGLIKPLFKKNQKFKVNSDCNVEPVDDQNVKLNKNAIFHEIAAFSKELAIKFESQ